MLIATAHRTHRDGDRGAIRRTVLASGRHFILARLTVNGQERFRDLHRAPRQPFGRRSLQQLGRTHSDRPLQPSVCGLIAAVLAARPFHEDVRLFTA